MLFAPQQPPRRRLQLRLSERRLLLMAGDALAVVLAVFLALFIWSQVAQEAFTLEFILPQSIWFFILAGLWFMLASGNSYYELPIAANRMASFQKLLLITLQMLVVYVVVFFFSDRNALPRLFIIYYGFISFALLLLWRMLNPVLIGWATTPRRLLIMGMGRGSELMIQTIRADGAQSYEVMGIIASEAEVGQALNGVPVIGTSADLLNFVARDAIKEIVIPSSQEVSGKAFQALMDAYVRGVVITPMPLLYERIAERVPVEYVGEDWTVILPFENTLGMSAYRLLKRGLDLLLAGAGLLVALLLFPLIALAIRLDSRGGIFYSQVRVGLYGRHFRIYKFRTMIQDAEKHTGAAFAQRGDPRITRVGRILRKTRLDELPQLLNVLRGEMSLIGPRPERPEHVSRLQEKIPFYRTRLILLPGLTGWAQVRYKYGENDEDALIKLQYDLYYIRHQSLLLDINILIRTVGKVLRMGGQ